jgi:AcrR family transcriptional regulator
LIEKSRPVTPASTTAGRLPLRERQRLARRERILDAAESLVREYGSTDFSMITLADRADLSQATLYALFGSKGAILYALLNRSLEETRGPDRLSPGADPVERVLDAAEAVSKVYASDSAYFRSLWFALLGADLPVQRLALRQRSFKWWRIAIDEAHQRGLLDGVIDADRLARVMMIHALGIVDLWVQNEIDDVVMRAEFTFGIGQLILPVAGGAARESILKRMQRAKRVLPASFNHMVPEHQVAAGVVLKD